MSGKREARQPREWALEPRDFGVNPRIRWHPPARGDAFEEICLRAAEIQHEVLLVANAHRKSRGDVAWSEIAGEFEMGYDQLLKVVRGQAHMSLRHAADFARVLGPVLMTQYRRMLLAKKESDD